MARSFRYDLLAQGGQRAGMDMYRKFRGAEPDKSAMLKARGLWAEPEPEVEEAELDAELQEATVEPGRRPTPPQMRPIKRPVIKGKAPADIE